MKRFLFILLIAVPLLGISRKNYSFPRLLYQYNLLVEKFEPFNAKLIPMSELAGLSDQKRTKFLHFMDDYNKIYYKELNFIINNSIAYFNNAHRFVPAHNDDIAQESSRLGASMPRFVLQNNLDADLILKIIDAEEEMDFFKSIDYWIFDKVDKSEYKIHTDLLEYLALINHYYNCADAGYWNINDHQEFDRRVQKDFRKRVRANKVTLKPRTISIIAGSAAAALIVGGLIGNL